jgi:hypothetical protein
MGEISPSQTHEIVYHGMTIVVLPIELVESLLKVKMRINLNRLRFGGTLPRLFVCLFMGFSGATQAAVCDVDSDGDVDKQDLRLIISARNTPASGPDDPRDADGDGNITEQDARNCVKRCNLKGCAIVVPPSPSDDPGPSATPAATATQSVPKGVSKPARATSEQPGTDIQRRTTLRGNEWKVKRGETLYAIGRAVYPGDALKQARLRQDIMKLNPSVFANGANKMAVGVVLKLPDYVVSKSTPSKVEPEQVPAPVPDTVAPKPADSAPVVAPASKPVDSAPVVTPASKPVDSAPVVAPVSKPVDSAPVVEPKPESQVKKEPPSIKQQPPSSTSRAEGNALVSLGYSLGGDKLVEIDGSYDLYAGSGGHLRLGYDQIYPSGSGYRIALGLQYNLVYDSGGNTTFRDVYLQLAYQYRANQIVYGIGAVLHEGATLEEDSTIEYDAANGLFVYLEDVGSSNLAGWGLSYTSLEIEEEDSSSSDDASRVEIYYNWRF